MKNITKKQGLEFNKKFIKGITDLGAIEISPYISSFHSFILQTVVGNLYINLPIDQSVCFTVFSRFKNIEQAKGKFDCNPYSGKYNKHTAEVLVNEAVEICLSHFRCTLP